MPGTTEPRPKPPLIARAIWKIPLIAGPRLATATASQLEKQQERTRARAGRTGPSTHQRVIDGPAGPSVCASTHPGPRPRASVPSSSISTAAAGCRGVPGRPTSFARRSPRGRERSSCRSTTASLPEIPTQPDSTTATRHWSGWTGTPRNSAATRHASGCSARAPAAIWPPPSPCAPGTEGPDDPPPRAPVPGDRRLDDSTLAPHERERPLAHSRRCAQRLPPLPAPGGEPPGTGDLPCTRTVTRASHPRRSWWPGTTRSTTKGSCTPSGCGRPASP